MKSLVIITLSLSLFISCSTTEPLKEVTHTYQNVNFSPKSDTKEINKGVLLTVTPVDASVMDSLTYVATFRTGAYEQEYITAYEVDPDEEDLSRSDRRYIENARKAIDEILKKSSDGTIPELLGRRLVERIWYGEEVGLDGSEIESFTNSNYDPSFNPYLLGNSYLSVFKFLFANNTPDIRKFSVNNFQIASSSEVLYPYSTDYLQERLIENDEKLNNANRFNFPDNLILTPKQIATKYIAVPAIDQSKGMMTIQYIQDDENIISYDFEVELDNQSISYELKRFQLEPKAFKKRGINPSFRHFYAVKLENGRTFPLKSNSFYVPNENTDQTVDICYAGIPDSKRDDYILECVEIDLGDYPKGKIN